MNSFSFRKFTLPLWIREGGNMRLWETSKARAKSTGKVMMAWTRLISVEMEGVDRFEINLFLTLVPSVFTHTHPPPQYTHSELSLALSLLWPFISPFFTSLFFPLHCRFLQETFPNALEWMPLPFALITPTLFQFKYLSSLIIICMHNTCVW